MALLISSLAGNPELCCVTASSVIKDLFFLIDKKAKLKQVTRKRQAKTVVVLTNKLKFFKAIFSSISYDKDPQKNWQKLDVYWEQMFTAKLTQYVVFNVVVKFIYDRDTSIGGQFLENASLGLSYKF